MAFAKAVCMFLSTITGTLKMDGQAEEKADAA